MLGKLPGLKKQTLFWAFLLIVVAKSFATNSYAGYGTGDALETVGISTAIGTVLGLSTIAFYENPTSQIKNALIGAGAGFVVGLGVAAYLLMNSPDEDSIEPDELIIRKTPAPEVEQKKQELEKSKDKTKNNSAPARQSLRLKHESRPRLFAGGPRLSWGDGNWQVLVPILELRF